MKSLALFKNSLYIKSSVGGEVSYEAVSNAIVLQSCTAHVQSYLSNSKQMADLDIFNLMTFTFLA